MQIAYCQAPLKQEVQSTRLVVKAAIQSGTIKSGGSVMVELTVRNVSRVSVRLEEGSAYSDYRVFLTNAAGKEPPRTALGERMLTGEVSLLKNEQIDLQPGDELKTTINLNKIFLFTPGTYSARFVRGRIWTESAVDSTRVTEVASSNIVVFSVGP